MTRRRIVYVGNQLSAHGFTPTGVETLGERLGEDFDVIRASSYKNMVLRMLHMWGVILRNRKADYLLIDTYSTSAFFFAWTSAKIAGWFGMRYIPILHGGALPERAKKSPQKLKEYFDGAFKIICPSQYLKVEMEQVIPCEYLIIPNAIDLKDYQFTLRQKLPVAFKMLWVRSFHNIYNPELAIHVLKDLCDQGLDVELCMVGPDKDGSLKRIQALAEQSGLLKRLKITGKISKLDWLTLSVDYDLFINTTNVDNTPVSVIEAMALGLPVVSTNVGGLPHLLKEDAILVEPNNSKAFTDAIMQLDSEDLYQSLSHQGGEKSREYAWSSIKDQWKEILE